MKPGTPVLRSTRRLDQVQERFRYLHYSLSTEKAYLYWMCFFIRWHDRSGGMRHPREMGAQEVEAFLTMWLPGAQKSPDSCLFPRIGHDNHPLSGVEVFTAKMIAKSPSKRGFFLGCMPSAACSRVEKKRSTAFFQPGLILLVGLRRVIKG